MDIDPLNVAEAQPVELLDGKTPLTMIAGNIVYSALVEQVSRAQPVFPGALTSICDLTYFHFD